tara:strand:- start:273 stop:806 length:534 start_codon:yes stop_codon:yes gene_type:complete
MARTKGSGTLTPQQEKFAQNVAKGMNKTEAAKQAGYSEKNATRAGTMLASKNNPKVMDRIQHLQEMGAMKAGLNLSTHLTDLKDIRDGAMRNGAWSAAVTAEVSRGKAAGLYINRSELTVNKVESMSKDDILARMQELSLDTAGILPSVDVIDVESEHVEDDADSPLGTQLSQNQSG